MYIIYRKINNKNMLLFVLFIIVFIFIFIGYYKINDTLEFNHMIVFNKNEFIEAKNCNLPLLFTLDNDFDVKFIDNYMNHNIKFSYKNIEYVLKLKDYLNNKKYKTHLIPSGIFYNIKSIIGPGCVVNIKSFYEEINYLKKNNPDLVADEYFRPHDTAVISIPQKAPDGATMRTESAFQLLERVKFISENYVKKGHRSGMNTHNVSATISVKEHEWEDIGKWMWKNKEAYNGLSILPYDGGTYKQAPFEDCEEATYDKMVETLKNINFDEYLNFRYCEHKITLPDA